MSIRITPVSLGLLAIALSTLGSASSSAQVIQLPTFRFFTVNTTVSVPDRGTVLLGGVNRVSAGSVTRGVPILGTVPGVGPLFKNRGIGREVSSSTATVSAYIIILEEEEQRQVWDVLAQRDRRYVGKYADSPAIDRKADFLTRHLTRHLPHSRDLSAVGKAAAPLAISVAEIRRQNQQAQQQRAAEAVTFFEKGLSAAGRGKRGAAKVFFNMALRRVLAHLQALQNPVSSEKIALIKP